MRHLKPELKEYFDSLLTGTPSINDPTMLLVTLASHCIGIKEEGGDNKGKVIELFQSTISKPVAQSWCMDFIQSLIAYVEALTGVNSNFPATESCMTAWNEGHALIGAAAPQSGDIAIWEHDDTGLGHTGVVVNVMYDLIETIEGNTSDSRAIDRNGDGVYQKMRQKGGSKTFKEVGFLRPF